MKKLSFYGCVSAMLLLLAALPLLAQTRTQPTSVSPSTTTPNRRGGQEPCWKQAGLSQQAQQQRHQIEEHARAEEQSVCNDSSLSQQQKRAKLREIHQQSRQQIERLMSPQQRQAIESCRSQRRSAGGGTGQVMRGPGGGGSQGPCGSPTSSTPGAKPFNDSGATEPSTDAQ
jgi:hypothetical protein